MKTPVKDAIARAILDTLISPNVSDSNWEAANVVDTLDGIGRSLSALSYGAGDTKGSIERAAETIADAIYDLARAIRTVKHSN